MITYISKRLLMLIPVFLGITFVTFTILKHIPGDPVSNLIGERSDQKTVEEYRSKFGLGTYGGYLKMLFSGNMGYSYFTKEPVLKTFFKKFPNTVKLAFAAVIISLLAGIFLGIISAAFKDKFWDRAIFFVTTCGISLPVFWWGLMLVIVFAYQMRFLPVSGMGRGELVYLILPALTLASRSVAYIARTTRACMLEVLGQPYIISARAKGAGWARIFFKHALSNVMIPVVTMAALDLGSYLNGAVLTETIFNWDGIGKWAVTAIYRRDYPVILAVVLFGAVLFSLINMLVDISYQFFNPKMR